MKFITKTRFNLSMWCPLLLYKTIHEPENIPELTEAQQAIIQQGIRVGKIAQQLFPGGVEIPRFSNQTQEQLTNNIPLYEAAFTHNDLYAQIDILTQENNTYHLIEVKSSTKVKDEHIPDVAFQVYVANKHIPITKVSIAHINTEYVRGEDLDIQQLFKIEDVTQHVQTYIEEEIEEQLSKARHTITHKPEETEYHTCNHPYTCPLEHLPETFELYRGKSKAKQLLEQNKTRWEDLQGEKLNNKQEIQLHCHTNNTIHVNKTELQHWLDNLHEPLTHLDFETINPAIPEYEKTKPYQHIPFQYSIHIQDKTITHKEYLGDGTTDPRKQLLQKLLEDIPEQGTILAHYATFEKQVLKGLAEHYPEHKDEIETLLQRIQDTITPFQNFWYYNPKQHGSCSIKHILPAITNLRYDDLEVQDGLAAQREYTKKPMNREALLAYCERDTYAMTEVIEQLRIIVSKKTTGQRNK